METTAEHIVKLLERRVADNSVRVTLCRSGRSRMKASVRLNESSEILGEIRKYVKNPERI